MSFNKKEFVTPASDLELAVTKEVSAANKESSNCSKVAFTLFGAMLVAVCLSQLYDGQNNVHDGIRSHVPTSRRLDGIPKDVEPTSNSPTANAEASEKAAAQTLAEVLKNLEAATQDEANARQEKDKLNEAQHELEDLQKAAQKAALTKAEKEAASAKAEKALESAVESMFFQYEQGEQGGTCAEGQSITTAKECSRAHEELGIHLSRSEEGSPSSTDVDGCSTGPSEKPICKIPKKANAPSSAKERADEAKRICAQPVLSQELAPGEVVVSLPGESGCLKSAGEGQQLIPNAQSECARFQIEEADARNYKQGLPGGACADGQVITTLQECRSAIQKLGIIYHGEWTSAQSIYVYGCSIKHTSRNMLHFNTNTNGALRSSETPICKCTSTAPGPAPSPSNRKQFKSVDHSTACLDLFGGANFGLRGCHGNENQQFISKGDKWQVQSHEKFVQAWGSREMTECSNLRDAEAAEKTAAKALKEAEQEATEASRAAEEAENKRSEADQKLAAKTEASRKAALAKDVAEAALAKAVAEAARCVGPAECLGRSKNVCEREGKCTWTGVFHGCAGSADCFGKKKGVCKRMMEKEGKCQWIPKPSAEVLPKCSSLAGDKTNLRQTAKFCWHLKGRADLCHTSYVSSSTNGFNKFIRMCRFEATTGKCKGDKFYCEP